MRACAVFAKSITYARPFPFPLAKLQNYLSFASGNDIVATEGDNETNRQGLFKPIEASKGHA